VREGLLRVARVDIGQRPLGGGNGCGEWFGCGAHDVMVTQ